MLAGWACSSLAGHAARWLDYRMQVLMHAVGAGTTEAKQGGRGNAVLS